MSLRARLALAMVALLAVGLLAADLTDYGLVRSFLTRRIDAQLEAMVFPATRALLEQETPVPRRPPSRTVIPPGAYAEIRDPDGRRVASAVFSYGETTHPLPRLPQRLDARTGEQFLEVSAEADTTRFRVLVGALPSTSGEPATVVVAIPLTEVEGLLDRLLRVEAVVSLAVIAALLGVAWWLVRRELRPLEDMAATAVAIADGDLSQRVERADARTEVGRLGAALNTMLTQIEAAFAVRTASEARLRRFVADASHELRTPLTSIRGYAELFRRGADARPQDLAKAMRRIEAEATRMGVLVDDLLLLARLDQGRPLRREPVDLVKLVGDAVSDARAVEPEREITFVADVPVTLTGDPLRLAQLIGNLLSNARIHTPAGTPVHVRATQEEDTAILEVADEGPGMDPEAAAHVFERFWRADPSRSKDHGGAGLGLSIVAAIAEAHGGTVAVDSEPGRGARFVVRLPLWSESPPAGDSDAAQPQVAAETPALGGLVSPDAQATAPVS